jgi:hypothetical protein
MKGRIPSLNLAGAAPRAQTLPVGASEFVDRHRVEG